MGHPLPIATALALALLLTAELGSCAEETSPPQLTTLEEMSPTPSGSGSSASSSLPEVTVTTNQGSTTPEDMSTTPSGSGSSASSSLPEATATTNQGSTTPEDMSTTPSGSGSSASSSLPEATATTNQGSTTPEDMSTTPSGSGSSASSSLPEATVTTNQGSTTPEDTSTTPSGSGSSASSSLPEATVTTNQGSTTPEDMSTTPSGSGSSASSSLPEATVTTNQGSTTPEDMSTTPSGSGSSASSSLPEATVTTRWTSSETEDTSPTSSPSNLSSTEMTEAPSKSPTTTPQAAPVGIALSFRITNRNFTKELENPSSEEFKNLSRTIGDVYQAIYNCSMCPDRDDYLGYKVISFSKGSVVVTSELHFRSSDNTSSSEFASRVEDSLKNANKSILQDLNMTDVKAEVSTPTPPTMGPPTGTRDTSLTHSPSGLTITPNPSESAPTPTRVSETSPTSSLATPEQFTTTENASLTSSPPGPNSNETTEEPPKSPTPTPELAPVWISLSFRIINRNFTDKLSNPDSEEFKNLSKTIGDVYEAIYNCSKCPYHDDFLGYRGISFSKGSIVVNSTLLYQATDLTTAAEFPTRVETSLTNASKEMRKDLEVTDVKAFNLGLLTPTTASTTKPTPRTNNTSLTTSPSNLTDAPNPSEDTPTPTQTSVSTEDHTPTESPGPSEDTSPSSSPSPSSPSSPTKTTKASTATPAITRVSLTYRITSMNFSEELSKPNSQAFDNLRKIIGEMYKDVYNSPSFKDVYLGYSIVSFSRGSVKVDSELQFRKNDRTSSPKFASEVETGLKDADKESHQGMELADIKATTVSSTSVPVTTKPDGSHGSDSSSSHGVPGWGIALLVLVSILLFLALLYSVYLIIRWCRRQSRGSMDLISTRDSYHPMNEYPTYETHGRYAAPGSKANPYNETLPRNGTSGFSYTNPVMANNNL